MNKLDFYVPCCHNRRMNKIAIIGDPHGNYDTLMALVAKLPPDTPLAFVGDLIDRGPKSKEVIEFVKNNGHPCVRGNHEIMMVEEGLNPSLHGVWIPNGGTQTLDSYKELFVYKDYTLPAYKTDMELYKAHIEWFKSLPLYIEFPHITNKAGRYLVISHSSLGKVWKWSEKRRLEQHKAFEGVIVWGRDMPKDARGIYNVFGHTPQKDGPKIKSFYANVDTGCFYRHEGYGRLTALVFPTMEVYSQENIDMPKNDY